MNAAVQQQSKAVVKAKEKINGFKVVESVTFCGKELSSATIPKDTDSIQPARLEPDGSAVVISTGQRADGLLLRKKNTNLGTRVESIEQHFVPFANICGISYGE